MHLGPLAQVRRSSCTRTALGRARPASPPSGEGLAFASCSLAIIPSSQLHPRELVVGLDSLRRLHPCILASLHFCGPQAAVGGPRPALPCHAVLCEQPQQCGHGASSGHAHAFSCLPVLECHSSCSRQCTRAASSCPVLPGEGHRGLHDRHRLQVPVPGPRWVVLPCCIWFSVGVLGPMLGCLCATFFSYT